MMFMGMAPFGSFFAGAIAAKVGAPLTVASGAIFCLIGAAIFLSRLSKLQFISSGPIQPAVDEPESM
jgi:membrane associated rhomboid family serine protease